MTSARSKHGTGRRLLRERHGPCRESGNHLKEARTLANLGDAHQTAGDVAKALDAWQHALAIFDDLDHPDSDRLRTKCAAMTMTSFESS